MTTTIESDVNLGSLGTVKVSWTGKLSQLLLHTSPLWVPIVVLALYARIPEVQVYLHWLFSLRQLAPILFDFLAGAYLATVVLWLLRKFMKKAPRKMSREDSPESFIAPHQDLFGVKWSPFLIFYGDVRDSIKISAPLCPQCLAPLYYESEADKKAECPTCKATYDFPREVGRTKEMARRHFIGLASKKELNFGNEPGPIGLLRRDGPSTKRLAGVKACISSWFCRKKWFGTISRKG